ncbi:hypothetical protein M5E06_17620 [Azospirillum sp. A1-3]|uniref:hypothetical protein n=1 Tax=Azospirillum sp. A1-3 TaxID=185874 RepID=UPI0020777CC6|nr:hypothetical protein [Azospirillum sp. A1-3]MCM8735954.1 hypothetical protein [Azospirillum sp. A1-3]
MDRYREALKSTLARLKASGQVDDLAEWCRRAGFKSSTVHEFLAGRTRSLTLEKIDALAVAAGIPVSVMLGETPAMLTEDDMRLVAALRHMDASKKQELAAWLVAAQTAQQDARKQ